MNSPQAAAAGRTFPLAPETSQTSVEHGPRRPSTLAEQLDAARSGEEFHQVLNNLFGYLETKRDEEQP
jgi:hypothetical protein